MILPERVVVKNWTRRVRATLRANPALAARRQRRLSPWSQQRGWFAVRWFMPFVAFFLGWSGQDHGRMFGFGLLWTLCVTFFRAANWAGALHSPDQLSFYFLHPVPDREVFAHQRTLLLRASMLLGLDWTAALLGFAVGEASLMAGVLAPLAGISAWAATLVVALLLVRFWPKIPYVVGSGLCWAALFLGLQWNQALISPLLEVLRVATPGGWIVMAWTFAHAGAALGWLALLLLGGGSLGALRLLLARSEAEFSLARIFAFLGGTPDPATAPADKAAPSTPSPETIARLRGTWRGLAARPPGTGHTPPDSLRNFILRLLPHRLRVLADFYRPAGQIRWDRGWLIALGGLLLAQLLRHAGVPVSWTAILSGASLGLFAVPLLGGLWPGFTSVFIFQTQIGMHSFLPLGFWETARLMLLTNGLRVLAAFPLVFLAARSGFTPESLSVTAACNLAGRICLLVAALQPIHVIMQFSRSTNDSSSRWWLTTLMIAGIPLGLVFLFSAGAALFAAEQSLTIALATLLLMGLPAFVLAAYAFAYHRGWFDLVNRSATPQG